LPFEIVLGVWNFSVMLQNVCFDKLNIFRLCKLYMHVICFCICIFSLKINKLQKKKRWHKSYCTTFSVSHPVLIQTPIDSLHIPDIDSKIIRYISYFPLRVPFYAKFIWK
jgi:hypothetical protein